MAGISLRGLKKKLQDLMFKKKDLAENPDTPYWRSAQAKLIDREKQLREQLKKATGN